jgi:hypothetical protein
MKIHFTTVVGSHLSVFDQMLKHYKNLGLESLLVNVNLDQIDDDLYPAVCEICRKYRAEVVSVFVGKWLQSVNPFLYRHTMQQAPNDWFLIADSDEFQVYPEGVEDVLQRAEKEDYDSVLGFVIDRLTRDGTFPSVDENVSVWDQFSLAGLVTFPLLGGNIMKVVAAKGCVEICGGQHFPYSGSPCPRSRICIPVHHFKWTSGLVGRLRDRVAFFKSIGDSLWRESQRLLAHVEQHGGRIDVTDPAFMLAHSGDHCPHETQLRQFAMDHENQMPRPTRF